MKFTHLFFDIGGVLGTNAWDHEQRQLAVRTFALEPAAFEERHEEAVGTWESGAMSLEEYLRCTVFYRPRAFTPEEFTAFMRAQSAPFAETIAIARALARSGRWRLATLNNESAELNEYRLRHFALPDFFGAFFSSCWLGALKPARRIYELALALSQADPGASLIVDDRERNLDTARALGMTTILYTDAERLRADLATLGVVA
ncbi:MAG: HAD family hydrolase [Gemmatimonadales bacterium]